MFDCLSVPKLNIKPDTYAFITTLFNPFVTAIRTFALPCILILHISRLLLNKQICWTHCEYDDLCNILFAANHNVEKRKIYWNPTCWKIIDRFTSICSGIAHKLKEHASGFNSYSNKFHEWMISVEWVAQQIFME